MTDCIICKESLGIKRIHAVDELCPVQGSWFCSKCGNHGHLAKSCDEINHVAPLEYFEDLIRLLGGDESLERWGLTDTKTPLPKRELTLEVAEREIARTNTIDIVYREGKQDSRIREVMRHYKIPTVHKMEKNLIILRNWAVRQGKKVRLVQDKT